MRARVNAIYIYLDLIQANDVRQKIWYIVGNPNVCFMYIYSWTKFIVPVRLLPRDGLMPPNHIGGFFFCCSLHLHNFHANRSHCLFAHTNIHIVYIYIIYIKSEYVQLCEKKERKTHRFNFYARAHFDCCVLLLLLPLFTCFFLFLPASASSSRAPKKIKSVTKNCITHAKCWQGKSATVKNDTNTFISGIRRKSEECEIKYIYTLWLLNYSKTIFIFISVYLYTI